MIRKPAQYFIAALGILAIAIIIVVNQGSGNRSFLKGITTSIRPSEPGFGTIRLTSDTSAWQKDVELFLEKHRDAGHRTLILEFPDSVKPEESDFTVCGGEVFPEAHRRMSHGKGWFVYIAVPKLPTSGSINFKAMGTATWTIDLGQQFDNHNTLMTFNYNKDSGWTYTTLPPGTTRL